MSFRSFENILQEIGKLYRQASPEQRQAMLNDLAFAVAVAIGGTLLRCGQKSGNFDSARRDKMRLYISVRVEEDHPNNYSYGNMTFNEDAQLNDVGFEALSEIFTECHRLLEAVKAQHVVRKES